MAKPAFFFEMRYMYGPFSAHTYTDIRSVRIGNCGFFFWGGGLRVHTMFHSDQIMI